MIICLYPEMMRYHQIFCLSTKHACSSDEGVGVPSVRESLTPKREQLATSAGKIVAHRDEVACKSQSTVLFVFWIILLYSFFVHRDHSLCSRSCQFPMDNSKTPFQRTLSNSLDWIKSESVCFTYSSFGGRLRFKSDIAMGLVWLWELAVLMSNY